ncbi:MAG: hypothetical protein H7125_06860 [Proteobacteria bacterium]|nr:hypothetical protein [Burkholderiales bacterium]
MSEVDARTKLPIRPDKIFAHLAGTIEQGVLAGARTTPENAPEIAAFTRTLSSVLTRAGVCP